MLSIFEGRGGRAGRRVASIAYSLIALILLVRFVYGGTRHKAHHMKGAGDDVHPSEWDRRIGSPLDHVIHAIEQTQSL